MKLSDLVPVVPASELPLIVRQTGEHIAYVIQRDRWLKSEPVVMDRIRAMPLYNHNLGVLKEANMPILCGKCGIAIREDVYVGYSGYCPDCLYKVNNKSKC